MKVNRLYFFYLFLMLCSFTRTETNELARTGKDHAVFFAIDDYQDATWQDLKTPIKDAEVIAEILREKYEFTTEILENPTKKEINQKLFDLSHQSFSPDAQLFIYMTGHGEFVPSRANPKKGVGYFIPADGDSKDMFKESYMPYALLTPIINDIPCKHIMVSIDACFSGSFFEYKSRPGELSQGDKLIRNVMPYTARIGLTSGNLEPVKSGVTHSPYASKFIEALNNGAGKDDILSVSELTAILKEISDPRPRLGNFGNHQTESDFLFIAKKEQIPTDSDTRSADFTAFEKAEKSDTKEAYSKYLRDFPNGIFRAEAAQERERLLLLEADEVEWKIAQRKNTTKAYEDYLNRFPSGKFKSQANIKLSKQKTETVKQAPISNVTKPAIPDDMVFIQGGTFQMGSSDGSSDEKPVHSVTLSSYYIGTHEVTFNEYDEYCNETGKGLPDDEGWGRDKRPVINVSWYDVVAYCNWRSEKEYLQPVYTINGTEVSANFDANGYRLPTEAEWEYAARSRGQNEKWAGTSIESSLSQYGNFCDKECPYSKKENQTDGFKYTAPVGSFRANSQGLHDMSGNVYEWCWDWKDSYSSSLQSNPTGPTSGSYRVIRGGSWYGRPSRLRCAFRRYNTPDDRNRGIGFRLSRAG